MNADKQKQQMPPVHLLLTIRIRARLQKLWGSVSNENMGVLVQKAVKKKVVLMVIKYKGVSMILQCPL